MQTIDIASRCCAVLLICVALLHGQAWAAAGSDNSVDTAYSAGWADGSNGGTGFGPWSLVSEATDGFAGFFIQNDATTDNGIDNAGQTDPDLGSAWTSYANKGGGIERATAYRPFSSSLDGAGDEFSVTIEHGFVNGLAGVALRNGNATTTPGDFSADARMQLFFRGGQDNYSLVDAAGEFDTGVAFSLFGIKTNVRLTGADTYDIDIFRYDEPNDATPALTTFTGRTLAGSGTIDSLALFQQDTEGQSDAFFNKLAYSSTGGSGADNASNYAGSWLLGDNFGSGFGAWEFATETDGGYAGQFIQSSPGSGVDNIGTTSGSPVAPDGDVWASYANKGNFADKSTQFRDIDNPLAASGDTFAASFEHGFIDPGGKIGVSLRDRAVDSFNETPDDYSDTARLQFYFEGGDSNYTIVDGDGELDTGIGFSFWGVDLNLTMTGPDTYNLDVTRYDEANDPSPEFFSFSGRTLAGSGDISSLAFFNVDGPTQSDVFFNNLSYTTVDAFSGDYNQDGTVDAADYVFWRKNDGTPGGYEAWRSNFGNTIGSGSGAGVSSVPEPTTLGLASLVAIAAGWIRRRKVRSAP